MQKILLAVSLAIFTLAAIFAPTNVWADEEPEYSNYDSIVNELKTSSDDRPKVKAPNLDFDWDEVAIHCGLALATSYVSVTSPNGVSGAGLLKGIEFNFGINLFTRQLRAEGAFSNFQQSEVDTNMNADLKQFDLRLIYMPVQQDKISLRLGLGLAARYLDLDAQAGGHWVSYQASTPSSIFLVGFERRLTPTLAIGPDISYRSSIVNDTYDNSSWDASFRLNATF